MQYPTLVVQNWNGIYLNDSFRVIKPADIKYQPGAIFEIKDTVAEGITMGFAKIATVSKILFKEINDNIAYGIINKPAPYLKTVLNRMYQVDNQDPINVMNIQWTERLLEAHRLAVLCHWDHIVKTTPFGDSSPYKNLVN